MNPKWITGATWTSKAGDILPTLGKAVQEYRECMRHELDNDIFQNKKRYRRGKNRCTRCGLKLNPV